MKEKVDTDILLEIIKDMGRARFNVHQAKGDLEALPDFEIIDPGKPFLDEETRKGTTMAKKPKPKPRPKC
jgi:hypothetical protein